MKLLLSSILFASACARPYEHKDALEAVSLGAPTAWAEHPELVAFSRSQHSLAANAKTSRLQQLDLRTQELRDITLDGDFKSPSQPQFVSPREVLFLDDGALYYVDTRSRATRLVLETPQKIETFKVDPKSGVLAFAVTVVCPDDTEVCLDMAASKDWLEKQAKEPQTARAWDKLPMRHWDQWTQAQTRRHVHVAVLDSSTWMLRESPRDIMATMKQDCPRRPFGGSDDFDIAPGGDEIVFAAKTSASDEAWSTDVDIYTVSLEGEKFVPKKITHTSAYETNPVYTPDSESIVFLAMRTPKNEADRNRIAVYNRRTGEIAMRTEHIDLSFHSLAFVPGESDHVIATAQQQGHDVIFDVPLGDGAIKSLSGKGAAGGVLPLKDGRILHTLSNMHVPADIAIDGKRITSVNEAHFRDVDIAPLEEFRFAGWNDEETHAWLVKPADFDPSKKYPVAFLVHGGPESAWLDGFSTRWNPYSFAGAGFVTVAVNFHGSTGYGQDFTDSIVGHWGDRPYEDLLKALDYMEENLPFCDMDKVVAAGGSYGGFMSNWLHGNAGDRFAGFVVHSGIFDNKAMYYTTEELFFSEYENGGRPPYEDEDKYQEFNPSLHVKNWSKPTLVITGGTKISQNSYGEISWVYVCTLCDLRSRLPSAGNPGDCCLHGPSATRHPFALPAFPGREPLDTAAGELDSVVQRGHRLDEEVHG
ncbi:MAG: hypothetical protein MHM6MM_002258 [Cercozoa sp. M6MM]